MFDNSSFFGYTLPIRATGALATGALAGPCNLQSATAGVMPIRGFVFMELPSLSGVDVWVLCNGNP